MKSPATMAASWSAHGTPTAYVSRGLERAVAVAQEHQTPDRFRCRSCNGACDGEVEAAVAGEVARHDRAWGQRQRVLNRGLEGAVAVAQQHRDLAVIAAGVDSL